MTHGGIGPSIVQMTLADLDRLDRFKEPTFDDHEDEEEIASEQSVNTGVDNISGAEIVIQKKAKEFCPPGMSELLWSGNWEH